MVRRPGVDDLALDTVNVEKIARHGILPRQVYEVLDNGGSVFRNRADPTAPYVFIELDNDGQCIAMLIRPTDVATVWRPVTAWYCKPSECARLGQDRRRR